MDKYKVLKKYFGHSAFRQGQEALIDCLLSGKDALGIMPTGGGKSLCYQVPSLMQEGISIVISPLISLMHDQVIYLKQQGVPAAYINSALTQAQARLALKRAQEGAYKLIYVAPERLLTKGFLDFAKRANLAYVFVDEAHCVSQWGQDFRPSYLNISAFIDSLQARPTLAAFTATATKKVEEDIVKLLKLDDPFVYKQSFDRKNLHFEVKHPKNKDDALLLLLAGRRGESGIIYCATRKNVDSVCDLLRQNSYAAVRYHAGLSDEERKKAQEDFQFDRARLMVATNAFGMGIDKPNVRFVIHYNMPKDLEGYYQEAGRAGRDGDPADCILLYSKRDVFLTNWLLTKSREESDLPPEMKEKNAVAEEERLKWMTYYATTEHCLRQFILKYFGEHSPSNCGACANCLGKQAETAPAITENLALYCLRLYRNSLALEMGLPPYALLDDALLRRVSLLPAGQEHALAGLDGMSEEKYRKYGENIRGLLFYIRRMEGAGRLNGTEDAKLLVKNYLGTKLSDSDILTIRLLKKQGRSNKSIALELGKSETAVDLVLLEMGVKSIGV